MINYRDSFIRAIILTLMVLYGVEGMGQSRPHTCATAVQFCSDCGLDIQSTSTSSFETGPSYDCLSYYLNHPTWYTQRAVVWFYFRIKDAGSITLSISCSNPSPDFICWGPFENRPNTGNLTINKKVVCDDNNYSSKSFTINNVQPGEYYMVAVSYFYQSTHLIVEKTGGTATTYCPSDVTITTSTGGTEICEGEEITLTAEATPVEFYSPGDILCTDGTVVKYANWPVSGKTAKGVVFYVDESGQHGWAMGLNENQVKNWCINSDMGYISGLSQYHSARDAIKDFNGSGNTQLISNPTTFPAAGYCIDQGGYLPSMGQLNVLFGELIVINNSLVKLGQPQIQDGSSLMYWSSTANSQTKVYRIDRAGQVLSVNLKQSNNNYHVRAVFDF